jgi:hypothetical protein
LYVSNKGCETKDKRSHFLPTGFARSALGAPRSLMNGGPMTDIITKPITKDEIRIERPRLHKVILVNDDFTPREFVVTVLKAEFRMKAKRGAPAGCGNLRRHDMRACGRHHLSSVDNGRELLVIGAVSRCCRAERR